MKRENFAQHPMKRYKQTLDRRTFPFCTFQKVSLTICKEGIESIIDLIIILTVSVICNYLINLFISLTFSIFHSLGKIIMDLKVI